MIQDLSLDPHLTGCIEGSLLLDLETGPTGGLLKIGAIRGDDTFLRQGAFDRHRALTEFDAFAAGCDYLLGHNLLGHDLPTLRPLAQSWRCCDAQWRIPSSPEISPWGLKKGRLLWHKGCAINILCTNKRAAFR